MVVSLALGGPAQAQTSALQAALDQPKWDAVGGFSLLSARDADVGDDGTGSVGTFQGRLDVGRYWTPHLKFGIHAASGPRLRTAALDYVDANGRLFPTVVVTHARLITLSPGVTYQFGDNAFLHPYVTGGLQIDLLQLHRERDPGAVRAPVPVPRIDVRETAVHTRPFAAAGFKAYFNRRVFVRPEATAGFGAGGVRNFTLHLGAGVDF
jgi:hypothetical protein